MTRRTLLVMLVLAACTPRERGPVAVGEPAPVYTASTLAGKPVSTGDFKGKVLLLNVWATWCAPCREEIPYLQSLYDRHRNDGFEIAGVSVDAAGSEETIQGFARDFKMTYPIWLDPQERVQTIYQALGVPASYLIDRKGIVRYRRLGIIRESDALFTQALAMALRETD